MELLLSISVGLGLSAAVGFRIFVPLLVMSIAARADVLALGPSFEWIASTPALVAFALATLVEIGAYYVPVIDNVLDAIAGPAAVVAGIIVSASVIGDIDPFLKWTLAVIAGGGVAGTVQALTIGTRGASTVTTFGLGNPVLSTLELGGSAVLSVAAILLPLLALVLVVALVTVLFVLSRRLFRRRTAEA